MGFWDKLGKYEIEPERTCWESWEAFCGAWTSREHWWWAASSRGRPCSGCRWRPSSEGDLEAPYRFPSPLFVLRFLPGQGYCQTIATVAGITCSKLPEPISQRGDSGTSHHKPSRPGRKTWPDSHFNILWTNDSLVFGILIIGWLVNSPKIGK